MLLEDDYGKTFVELEFPRKKLVESQTVCLGVLEGFTARGAVQRRHPGQNNTSEDGQTHPTGGQYLFPQTKESTLRKKVILRWRWFA